MILKIFYFSIRFPIFLGKQKERNRKENQKEKEKKKTYRQADESDLRVDQKP